MFLFGKKAANGSSTVPLGSYTRSIIIPPTDETDLPSLLLDRLRFRLSQSITEVIIATPDLNLDKESIETLLFSIGNNPVTRTLISVSDVNALGPEGYVIKSKTLTGGSTVLAIDGQNAKEIVRPGSGRTVREWVYGIRGLAYGVY
ncbi:hypothetical protein HDU76_008733, partial [Blyttiomyces sp. JEL0837]